MGKVEFTTSLESMTYSNHSATYMESCTYKDDSDAGARKIFFPVVPPKVTYELVPM